MTISRHTLFTLGMFALLLGTLALVLGILGVAFRVQSEYTGFFLAVCPLAFFLPGALLTFMSYRLGKRNKALRELAGTLEKRPEIGVAEIAERFHTDEAGAARLALMAIREGYVEASYDPAKRVLRR